MGNKFLQVIILWHFTILSQNEKRQCCRLTPPPDLILITFILGNIPSLFFVLSHPPSKVNFKYPTASFMTSITCHSPHPPHYFHWQNHLIDPNVVWQMGTCAPRWSLLKSSLSKLAVVPWSPVFLCQHATHGVWECLSGMKTQYLAPAPTPLRMGVNDDGHTPFALLFKLEAWQLS